MVDLGIRDDSLLPGYTLHGQSLPQSGKAFETCLFAMYTPR
jgi:hypothetical protein